MKVKELMEYLRGFDPEMEVVLQKDSEGNGYSPLAGADDQAIYVPDSTWGGEVYDLDWSAEDADMDEEEWEQFKKDNPQVVILWPVN